jgi:DNA-binding transcriptional ArsR family regulator
VSEAGADDLSLALAAVAHPLRRELLRRTQGGPVRVTDLAVGFNISLPAVSRHLRVLEAAGLVTRRVEGRDHFIEARAEGLTPVDWWMREQSQAWQDRLERLKQLMEQDHG